MGVEYESAVSMDTVLLLPLSCGIRFGGAAVSSSGRWSSGGLREDTLPLLTFSLNTPLLPGRPREETLPLLALSLNALLLPELSVKNIMPSLAPGSALSRPLLLRPKLG